MDNLLIYSGPVGVAPPVGTDSKRAPLLKRKLTSVAAMISALRPIMDLAEPILKAKPEVCEESHLDN
ncbi:hypothetical protein [Blautia wexlerae]|uniref:hypothetical protein n=1 Tax=Blautia wexlerae TaxID=418240 RepID=UPI0006DCB1B4|nr:hypothetical protein [Blautia wexlerae]